MRLSSWVFACLADVVSDVEVLPPQDTIEPDGAWIRDFRTKRMLLRGSLGIRCRTSDCCPACEEQL